MDDNRDFNASDLAAINEVLTGNTAAFSKIVGSYQKSMLRLAVSYLGDNADAEDAVQEIFLKVYKSLRKFSLDRRFKPWLYSIAANHLKNRLKAGKRVKAVKEMEQRLETSSYPGPEEAFAETEREAAVRAAVLNLPDKLRQTAALYYLQELSVAEVGEILNLGEENVKSRLHRARKKLREYFDRNTTAAD